MKKFVTQSWRQRSRTRSSSVREANKDLFLTQYQHWNKARECEAVPSFTHTNSLFITSGEISRRKSLHNLGGDAQDLEVSHYAKLARISL